MANWPQKPPPLLQLTCTYCKGCGYDYHGHSRKNCPKLNALKPCPNCGLNGHTTSHCPTQKPVNLRLRQSFKDEIKDVHMGCNSGQGTSQQGQYNGAGKNACPYHPNNGRR